MLRYLAPFRQFLDRHAHRGATGITIETLSQAQGTNGQPIDVRTTQTKKAPQGGWTLAIFPKVRRIMTRAAVLVFLAPSLALPHQALATNWHRVFNLEEMVDDFCTRDFQHPSSITKTAEAFGWSPATLDQTLDHLAKSGALRSARVLFSPPSPDSASFIEKLAKRQRALFRGAITSPGKVNTGILFRVAVETGQTPEPFVHDATYFVLENEGQSTLAIALLPQEGWGNKTETRCEVVLSDPKALTAWRRAERETTLIGFENTESAILGFSRQGTVTGPEHPRRPYVFGRYTVINPTRMHDLHDVDISTSALIEYRMTRSPLSEANQ